MSDGQVAYKKATKYSIKYEKGVKVESEFKNLTNKYSVSIVVYYTMLWLIILI